MASMKYKKCALHIPPMVGGSIDEIEEQQVDMKNIKRKGNTIRQR